MEGMSEETKHPGVARDSYEVRLLLDYLSDVILSGTFFLGVESTNRSAKP
jgi:hypothetical protein